MSRRTRVKGHTRRTPSGRVTKVRPHVRVTEREWEEKPKSMKRVRNNQRFMKITSPTGEKEFIPIEIVTYGEEFLPRNEFVEGDLYEPLTIGPGFGWPLRHSMDSAVKKAQFYSAKGYDVRFKELDNYYYIYLHKQK